MVNIPTRRRCFAYLATGFLAVDLVASMPKPPVPFNDPVDLRIWLGDDISPGKCAEFNDFSSPEKRLKIFNEGNAWEVLDKYLSMRQDDPGYAKNWVGDMYLSAIHDGTKSDMECSLPDSKCDGLKTCGEYRGWGSVFYIMKSMENLFQYFKMRYRYGEALRGFLERDLEIFMNNFKMEAVKVDDKSLGAAKVLTAALNIAAGLTAGIPVASGVFTVSAGISSLLEQEWDLSQPQVRPGTDLTSMRGLIPMYINSTQDGNSRLHGALFGKEWTRAGTQDKVKPHEGLDIPQGMQVQGGNWFHAITRTIGDGQWLVDKPINETLNQEFTEIYKRTRQALGTLALSMGRRVLVVINDADNQEKCNSNDKDHKNNIWDDERKWCYGLMFKDEKGLLEGGINEVAEPLWQSFETSADFLSTKGGQNGFGIDKLEFYRNVLDCWITSDGHFGEVQPHTPSDGNSLPRCFFRMEVKKGEWFWGPGQSCFAKGNLRLDTSFPNFSQDDSRRNDFIWPGVREKPKGLPGLCVGRCC